ncbi:hypothetical protein CFH99_15825 [Nocardioides aromaticivorans]|uniref:Uncharacterized protein n=1 Tax=Nocardioides aromaticivorans TaxID=200618 RepID=A0ABX7PMF5_9ACTN|nr:hypothetical protein [Nocardioides aromaticivorans]QSR27095.1 hypothetical protein CFH99_15825 [Nocardioides aromaticivorans]
MEVQELVTTAGPWIAAGAGLLTAATAISGAFGAKRLQSNVERTSELIKALPDDGVDTAREGLVRVLDLHVDRLLQRVEVGIQFTRRQALTIATAAALLLCATVAATLLLIADLPSAKEDQAFQTVSVILAALMIGLGYLCAIILLEAIVGGAERWLRARIADDAAKAEAPTFTSRVIFMVFAPMGLLGQIFTKPFSKAAREVEGWFRQRLGASAIKVPATTPGQLKQEDQPSP